MLALLASGFLRGIFFGVVLDFIRTLVGRRRMIILLTIFLSASFYSILTIGGVSSLMAFGEGLLTWGSLAFFLGLFPGGWMGTALGHALKEGG